MAALLVLGILGLGVSPEDLVIFTPALLCGLAMLALVKRIPKTNHRLILIATYLTIAATAVYGLAVSYRSPDQYTVTFIALMCLVTMTFVDKPRRLGIAVAIGSLLCVVMILTHKSASIRIPDLINVVAFTALASISGSFTVNRKIHGYVMDRLHEQDLERGKQQLSAKEAEAQQLLTAVKATHDMVVSVNLTKNTYRLIGEESFVTSGDDVEGSFDEVIGIHASKVVPGQRQLYIDTFSRQGLLNAYAQGKKEVYLEYQQCDDDGVPHWLGTHTMFTVDPHSPDVTEITISQNIDERVRRDEETKAILQAERDKAEQAQKTKTDFLFQMSHDIRTPMNAIIGFANFIKSSNDLDAIHNDYVLKLETAGQQLLMLINDALEMSRIESGKLAFRREVLDVRSIMTNVLAVMQLQAEEKGLSLTSSFAVEHPIVNCDQNHMSRVVMNLVSNAVKFTPPGGKVHLSLRELPQAPRDRTAFELQISDTGIGMSPEFMEKVFEPFEREQSSTVSGMQGTGLGLAIVKRIVEAAGDTITVQSTQGQGTTFTLHLTLRRPDDQALQQARNQAGDTPALDEMAKHFKGKRILLVEDNEFNLIIAQTLLEKAGFSVEAATDGSMAVNKIMRAPTVDYYDVVLMDIQMPVMDGYEATRAIRSLPDKRATTPILALTANAFDTDKENAARAGMNGHIAKPIDMAALYQALWKML